MIARALMLALAVSALAAGSAAAADPPKCMLGKVAELPVTMSAGRQPLVPVKINGQDLMLMADSGAFYSFVTSDAAQRLKLHQTMAPFNMRVIGTTGDVQVTVGHADSFVLDGIPLGRADFLVGGRAFTPEASGILGDNILSALDVEYDFAHGVIRLFKPQNCGNAVPAYWAKGMGVGEVALIHRDERDNGLHGEGKINGQTIRITFDTGAALSGLKLSTAQKLGFDRNGPATRNGGLSGGANGGLVDSWVAPFQSLDIGGEEIRNIELRVSGSELLNEDMLLGADFFLSHRVYVSRGQHKLYFTYNGGPVFRLDRPIRPGAAQQAANAAAPQAAAPGVEEPTDAAGYQRRADAEIARRDFGPALADLTKAMTLAPADEGLVLKRATTHLAAREPVLAMADLDAALKLDPKDAKALLLRGEMYLASHDAARAEADFQSAQAAAPAGSRIPLSVAIAYERQAQFDKAIALYDAWIAAHPKDPSMGGILQSRCWARTLTGKDLQAALTDCEQALRRGPEIAAMYNARGLTLLRLGRYDEAIRDYDRAIRMQPKMPWALLGRGYARHAKGMKAEGDADLAAAKALAPNLPAAAQKFGITDGV